ncbi:orotate phosphoribosyltransferase [Spirochaetia bacterium]|nr:orotate phosphoribosyltransferase [Spirochaetia bacterium]
MQLILFYINKKNANDYVEPIYIDIRYTLGSVVERTFIIQKIEDTLIEYYKMCDLVAGVSTAGIPFAAIVANNLCLPMCYVRQKSKANGMGKRIEGRINKHQKTVIIEDVVYSGSNVLNVFSALRKEELDILGVISIFSYDIDDCIRDFKDNMIHHQSLTNFDEVISLGFEKGIINNEEYKQLLHYKENLSKQALYSNVTW